MIDSDSLNQLIKKYYSKNLNLIALFQNIQSVNGYIDKELVEFISKKIKVSVSTIYGVLTFYKQFRLVPVGKHLIKVCHGTACHVNGSEQITRKLEELLSIDSGDTTEDKVFTLEKVACLGCCSLAPVMMIDEEIYGNLTTKKLKKIIESYRQDKLVSKRKVSQ